MAAGDCAGLVIETIGGTSAEVGFVLDAAGSLGYVGCEDGYSFPGGSWLDYEWDACFVAGGVYDYCA